MKSYLSRKILDDVKGHTTVKLNTIRWFAGTKFEIQILMKASYKINLALIKMILIHFIYYNILMSYIFY